jgi:hypothetical protein
MNRSIRIMTLFLLAVALFSPQSFGLQTGDSEMRIFKINSVDLNDVYVAISIFTSVTGVQIQPVQDLNVISVIAPRSLMPAIERTIRELDQPPPPPPPERSVGLTLHVLRSTDQQRAGAVPAVLQPVVKQLNEVLSYGGFELLDTQIVRGIAGRRLNTSGNLPGLADDVSAPLPPTYSFVTTLQVRSPGDSVALQQLRFTVTKPTFISGDQSKQGTGWQNVHVEINTDVEVPAGQQVVVGKTTVGKSALILVISARLDPPL